MSANGTIAAAVVSARSSTSVTINESLLSTDTIFMGDDTNRNIHDGDPLDIRTRISAIENGTGTVSSTNLAADSVVTAKILDANVTTAKIADANVTTAKIATGAVTPNELATDSVVTDKILDGNVTSPKLALPTAGATYLLANIILDTGTYAVTTGDTSYSAYSHFHIGCPSVFANTISWCAIQTGTYRVVVKHTRQTATTYVRALKNNALVSEFAYTGAVLPAYATREWDIAVNKGDLITIQHKCASTATSHLLFMGIYSATDVIGGA